MDNIQTTYKSYSLSWALNNINNNYIRFSIFEGKLFSRSFNDFYKYLNRCFEENQQRDLKKYIDTDNQIIKARIDKYSSSPHHIAYINSQFRSQLTFFDPIETLIYDKSIKRKYIQRFSLYPWPVEYKIIVPANFKINVEKTLDLLYLELALFKLAMLHCEMDWIPFMHHIHNWTGNIRQFALSILAVKTLYNAVHVMLNAFGDSIYYFIPTIPAIRKHINGDIKLKSFNDIQDLFRAILIKHPEFT